MLTPIVRLLLCLLFIASPLNAQSTRLPPDAQRELDEINAPLVEMLNKASFSGSVGIRKGNISTFWNYPRAKAGHDDDGHDADLWRWASVTKQVVAVLVLQEVAKGRIDLDQPISKYLPKFKSANAGKISVRQLLRHQSGLPNPDDVQASSEAMSAYYMPFYKGSRDPLTGYCAGTPKSEPGGNWTYNNCDYIVAGALLEAVTGKKWQKLVAERVAKPLGLKTLSIYPTGKVTRTGLIGGKPEPKLELAAFASSGGLYGSLEDLLKFDKALMSGELLAQKELNALWDGQADLGYMALGQWVFDAGLKDCTTPVKLVERRGSIGGVQVRNFIAPERQMAIAIFTDKSESDFEFGEIWQGSGFSHDVLNFALCSTLEAPK